MESKLRQMNIATKWKQTHRRREQTCGCRGGGGERTGRLGSADAVIHRMDKQQDPTMQHRELIQSPVINHDGKEYEKEEYICITESLC